MRCFNNKASLARRIGADGGISCRFGHFGQLQQFVHRADQAPFALHLRKSAQQKLPEFTTLFDLTEDRLGQYLAESVATAPTGTRQFGSHRRHASTSRTRRRPVAAASL